MTTTTLEHSGLTFGVSLLADEDQPAPWADDECTGNVVEVHGRDYGRIKKEPGQRVLYDGGRSGRSYLYDYAGTIKRAKRDGWGVSPSALAKLEARIGCTLSPGAVTAAAVDADFARLRDWCDGHWYYVWVRVVLLDIDGAETDFEEVLGGVESGDHSTEVAYELASEIAASVGPGSHVVHEAGARFVRQQVRPTPATTGE